MSLLRDQNLLGFLSEGYFYLIDFSYASDCSNEARQRPIVKINIRIPHEQIKTFDIDVNMTSVVLGTNSGNVYVYDLPKALENERVLNKKRIEMGVEEELVYTYFERAHFNELNECLLNQATSNIIVVAAPHHTYE